MPISKNLSLRTLVAWIGIVAIGIVAAAAGNAKAAADAARAKPHPSYAVWKNGPDKTDAYFPLAVWLQEPKNAPKYRAIGINLYVALWDGPNEKQIAELKKDGMPVICAQNDYALKHLDEKIIVGWMHGDEPDNAQSLPDGKGYGPPIAPEKILADYQQIKAKDPTRPVMLNLGQGVAWDDWYGRGVRSNHPEDYAEYCHGGDILSFDIYPAVHEKPAVAGKLWYVPYGVERLQKWARDATIRDFGKLSPVFPPTLPVKIVWNCIECTHIGNPDIKPTPEQVRGEVWMSIISGSKGIIYFCHQFKPTFIEAGLLADEEMSKAVAAINREIQSLAAVINSPTVSGLRTETRRDTFLTTPAERSAPSPPVRAVAAMAKKYQGATYLFGVEMHNRPAATGFKIPRMTGQATAEVLGESRTLPVQDGSFQDDFRPWDVHLYRIKE
jgi:hypothetical protein